MASIALELRKHLGLLQSEVGQVLGISQSAVSKMELNNTATLPTLALLADHRGKRLVLEITNEDGSNPQRIAVPVPEK